MTDQTAPAALKLPRMFNGKPIRFVRPSKNNPIFTRKYADGRQKIHQAMFNPVVKRLPIVIEKPEEIKVEEIKEEKIAILPETQLEVI
jgi:hypothetical protein